MLDKLGFKKRTHVGIAVSINNTIELAYIDSKNKSLVNYVAGNVKYNSAVREIIDFEEFTEAVVNLFDAAGLSPEECAVSLTIPNVCFGIVPNENSTEQAYIIENLQTELEDLYVFKKNEPIISYSILQADSLGSSKNIVYSAVQTKIVVKILEIFDRLGIEIERIDTAYSSMLRAIRYCDKFSKFVQKEERTALVLITPNTCCLFRLKGGSIIAYKEQPLAVKSFSPEEVFSAISTFIERLIEEDAPQSLLIVSETDDVSPELLVERLNFAGELDYAGVHANVDDQLIRADMFVGDPEGDNIQDITLEAIGSAIAYDDDYELNINFIPAERLKANIIQVGEYEIEFTRYIVILLIAAVLLGVALGMALKFVLSSQAENQAIENSSASKEIKDFEERLKKGSSSDSQANVFPIMQKIINSNKSVINAYTGLSTEIPDNIYIKKFVTGANGGIGIVGESTTSEDVERFASKLKERNEDLMVSKISVNTKNDPIPANIPNGFTFEIKTSNAEINLYEDDNLIQNAVQETVKTMKKGKLKSGAVNNTLVPPPAPVI